MIHFGHVSQRINLGYFASCEPTCQPVTDLDSRPVEVFRADPEPCKFDGAVEPEEALQGGRKDLIELRNVSSERDRHQSCNRCKF
ncbi:hypothetical protein AGR4A_Lc120005 [Agrobacterium tumefaciens str. B6]|uniref:Uncharacterized protein n=1 Tax=Agrobacterium tumefaciens str. B6 TaxID=1183423 RepID=A0A822V302_AGRTU|nr:hypothetical protein AGR4A_Lc120005 [Agrobacterium tumefaciens str. B6]